MRILLADDQKELRLLTARQLQQDGHSVVAVGDGAEALTEFDRAPFDVILLDELMPALSGVEVLHAIRAKQEGKRQIVIALTGYNTEPDRQRLLHEGFDSVIGKPFRLDRLEATLRSVLDARASTLPAGPQPVTAPSAANDVLKSLGGDEKLLRRMIQTFLRDTPKRLAQIESAIRRDRADVVASLAHALKGSVAIFGAVSAQQSCQELQEMGRRRELAHAAPALELLKEEIAKLEANLRGYAGQTSLSVSAARNRKRRGSGAKKKPR